MGKQNKNKLIPEYPKLINKKLLTTNLLIYHYENKLNTVDDLANLNLLTVKKIGGG